MKSNKNGFTLIELLVVVAIIGILATIVMASLSSARLKAKDAAVLSNAHSLRNEIELEYDGTYTTMCSDGGGAYDKFEQAITSQGGEITECDSTAADYRVLVVLPSALAQNTTPTAYAAGENGLCVNSNGKAMSVVFEESSKKIKINGVKTSVKTFSFDAAIPSPACSAGEVSGGIFSQYCTDCSLICIERNTSTGVSVGTVGIMPQAECSGVSDCGYNNACF